MPEALVQHRWDMSESENRFPAGAAAEQRAPPCPNLFIVIIHSAAAPLPLFGSEMPIYAKVISSFLLWVISSNERTTSGIGAKDG